MDKKKVLVLGATGMAGHVVYKYLESLDKYELSSIVFRTKISSDSHIIDVTNESELRSIIETNQPNILINCIGVLINGSKTNPKNAIYINSVLPHLLKDISDSINAKLIHISTDCVFSGNKGMYTEDDFKDANDVYGRSKALGEIDNIKDLTIRTSIIGPELKINGEGLFHWFMNQTGSVNGYETAIWGGVTTIELAKAIDYAIDNNTIGLVHLSNGDPISKYEMLKAFKYYWCKKIVILPFHGNKVDKSISKSTKFDYLVPKYHQMFTEMKLWMDTHQKLYQHYYKG